jgi:CHASE3 domain sensor protein
MKKAILTIGLFSLVMVLTSFTSNEEVTSTTNDSKAQVFKIENTKLDIVGNGSTSAGNKKMD